MKLWPFFCYFGGKWRNTPHYPPAAFPTIIEPFAGAAGYSLRHPERQVLLYDLDPCIAGLWQYLIAVSEAEILALPDLYWDDHVDDFALPQEARWLIGFWLNKATTHPCKRPSRWMIQRIRPKSFWGPEIRQRIAGQLQHIRHWKAFQGSYTAAPDIPATWFIDPPYQGAGVHYRHGSRGFNYIHLGAWSRVRQGQVLVCENSGAAWLPFGHLGDFKAANSRAATNYSKEALWEHWTEV
jgi:hypothetical protein